MNDQTTPSSLLPEVKLPVIRTGSIGVFVCVVVAIAGGLIAQQRGGSINDGFWTLVATIPGMLIPMGILSMMPPKPAPAWCVPVLAGTMIRAMTVLTIGLAVYMLISPERVVFFLTMLSALMITLVIDVAAVLSLIQKHTVGDLPMADAEGIS